MPTKDELSYLESTLRRAIASAKETIPDGLGARHSYVAGYMIAELPEGTADELFGLLHHEEVVEQ